VQERAGNTLEERGISKDFLNRTPAAQQLREILGLYKIKKLLHNKRNSFYTEETTHRVGENICQLYIRQKTDNQHIQEAGKISILPKSMNQ
jgi:hypothetical protein